MMFGLNGLTRQDKVWVAFHVHVYTLNSFSKQWINTAGRLLLLQHIAS